MLGILRDSTGSFAAGFYMVAIADVFTLILIVVLVYIRIAGTEAVMGDEASRAGP